MSLNTNDMADWIYLESSRLVDLYAFSVALDVAAEKKRIVRTTAVSSFLADHPNVEVIGFPSKEESVISVSIAEDMSFNEAVNTIVSAMGGKNHAVSTDSRFHCPIIHKGVCERVLRNRSALIYLLDNRTNPIDLMFIDETCRLLFEKGIQITSIGELAVPCIRGTMDLRSLLSLPEIVTLLEDVPFIICNNMDLAQYCCIRDKHVFFIEQTENGIQCNGAEVSIPGQIANMILKTTQ